MKVGANRLKIISIAAILLILVFPVSALKSTQNAGIGHKVTVSVERSDYTITELLGVYCRYYNVDSCQDGVTIWNFLPAVHHYLFVEPDEPRSSSGDVQTFSASGKDSSEARVKRVQSFNPG